MTQSDQPELFGEIKPAVIKVVAREVKRENSIDHLPPATVSSIVLGSVPTGCKISQEADTAIRSAASVFVLFATNSAKKVAQENNRRNLIHTDVIKAMEEMDLKMFVKPLQNQLSIWRKGQKEMKDAAAKKRAEVKNKEENENVGKFGDHQNLVEIE